MQEEQRKFEEENMVRLVLSKKERKLRRQQRREASRLHTLADLEGAYTAGVLGFVSILSPGGLGYRVNAQTLATSRSC